MKKFDCIIVGAGPSGIAAAKVLSDNNINYCIIEKYKFPRNKLCGGGLTNKTIKLLNKLDININSINKIKLNKLVFISKGIKKELTLTNPLTLVDRIDFDYNNFKQINNIHEEEYIININNNILETNKDKYEFKYIIFADGVNGYSRTLIKKRNLGLWLETKSNETPKEITLDFSALKDGYGWIFPKKDHSIVGVGNFNNQNVDYFSILKEFANKHNIKIDNKQIRGYFIPTYSKEIYKQSVIDNKYILVGDAASLVDRVTAEGIYYALLSGMLAAESIIDALNTNNNLKDIYFTKTKNMYKALNKRLFWGNIMYSKIGIIFIKLGLNNKKILNKLNKIFG